MILNMIKQAGYEEKNVLFVSAFEHQSSAPLKSRFSGVAVNSLIWCMAEPELLIWLEKDHISPFKI